jgi:hypothetical protein
VKGSGRRGVVGGRGDARKQAEAPALPLVEAVPPDDTHAPDQSCARESSDAVLERAGELMPPEGGPPRKAVRVRFVRRLMEDDLWVRGRTAPALGVVWGLKTATVEHDAAEASHQLEDPAELETGRRNVATRSIDWADEAHGRGALEAAGRLLELHGRVTGAIAPAGAVNVLVDARTGALKPEVAGAMQAAQDTLLAACRRAGLALAADVRAGLVAAGDEGAAFDAALVAEMDAPQLGAGGG